MPLKVLVVYMPGQTNENFVVSLIRIVAQMHESGSVKPEESFKVHIIPGWKMSSEDMERFEKLIGKDRVEKFVEFNNRFSSKDMWMQDWGEVGVIRIKGEKKPQTVVFDSNRGRGGAELPEILASFWNSYLVKNPSNQYSCGDYGGNIEVTPDNILLIGNTSTNELRSFLENRGYKNRMAVLETDWLTVGHVDEYISICPNKNATRGYTLIKANPRLALKLIKSASEKELMEISHKDYREALIRVRNYLHRAEVQRAKAIKSGRRPSSNKPESFSEAVLDYINGSEISDETLPQMISGTEPSKEHGISDNQVEDFIKLNLTIGNLIDTNVKNACRKISEVRGDPQKPHSIISFPALFRKTMYGNHIAYLPGSVNQLILNDQLIVPDPKVKAMRMHIKRVVEKMGLHPNFIDSLPYHNLQGQLHCGSNVFRHPNRYFVKPR
ncbi:MAG: protein-arginine deiminase family protein [Candidatus Rifleibacteriota bacterium]